MKFIDLKFEKLPYSERAYSEQARVSFANGYGASIVRGPYTYGGREGLYELAVISNDKIDYTTPITDDVEGWLTPERVMEILAQIEALPKVLS